MDINPETIIILLQSGVPAWIIALIVAAAGLYKMAAPKKRK